MISVKTMRAVDRFAGIPLCWISGIVTRILPGRPRRVEPESILVMKFFGIGSILLSTPFLTALREGFPKSRITFITFEKNAEMANRLPQFDQQIIISTRSFTSFFKTLIEAFNALRKLQPDVVFDLEFFSKFSTLLSTVSGAPMRIGFELPTLWRYLNITHSVPIDHSVHVTRLFLHQLTPLGIHTEETSVTRLIPTPDETKSLLKTLNIGSDGETIVINLNAGTTSLDRRWPAQRFIELVRALAEEDSARRFYFIGQTDEREYVALAISGLTDLASRVVNCAGMLSFCELVALLHKASLLVTNDSGPMHIASSAGTPVVALFGPESPQFYGPIGKASVVYKSLPCSPCLSMYNAKSFVCPYNAKCMQDISTKEVLAAVRSMLEVGLESRSVA